MLGESSGPCRNDVVCATSVFLVGSGKPVKLPPSERMCKSHRAVGTVRVCVEPAVEFIVKCRARG
jgi:hypothetical protein